MYWGGYACVFGSSPDLIPHGSRFRWIQLNWTAVTTFVLNWIMFYHGVWFMWWAYDTTFSRMPCGTYQFFLAPLLDPSTFFGHLRDVVMSLSVFWLLPSLLNFPIIAVLAASELKHSILDSAVTKTLQSTALGAWFSNASSSMDSWTGWQNFKAYVLKTYRSLRHVYRSSRKMMGLPEKSAKGIRLITQLELEKRR
jgi:hypothetical protein